MNERSSNFTCVCCDAIGSQAQPFRGDKAEKVKAVISLSFYSCCETAFTSLLEPMLTVISAEVKDSSCSRHDSMKTNGEGNKTNQTGLFSPRHQSAKSTHLCGTDDTYMITITTLKTDVKEKGK